MAVPITSGQPLGGTDRLLLGCLVQYEAEQVECRTLCLWDEGDVNVSSVDRMPSLTV